jgi:hypothetical protein
MATNRVSERTPTRIEYSGTAAPSDDLLLWLTFIAPPLISTIQGRRPDRFIGDLQIKPPTFSYTL